jgi:CelD/BcsL family acetyltransferase involved in cellulose biosynthesis
MKINIQVIDTTEGLKALQDDWDKLLGHAEYASVFSSWEWQYHWWKHYGKHHALRILVVRNENKVVGILPVYIQSVTFFRFLPLSILRLVGTGGDTSPDYICSLLEPEFELVANSALSEFILHKLSAWDVLDFTDMPRNLGLVKVLTDMCDRDGLSYDSSSNTTIPIIRLPATWEEYLSSRHKDYRYEVRKSRRKASEVFTVNFHVWESYDRLDEVIDRLISLHKLRWQQSSKQSTAFASPEYIAFHRDAIKTCFNRDWIRLYCLTFDTKIVAIYYCYRFRNEVLHFQSGFDPAFEDYAPGHVLMGYAVEHAINEGNKVFDLLKGQHPYKKKWANDSRQTCGLSVYRANLRGRAYEVRTKHLPALKKAAKSALRSIGLVRTP